MEPLYNGKSFAYTGTWQYCTEGMHHTGKQGLLPSRVDTLVIRFTIKRVSWVSTIAKSDVHIYLEYLYIQISFLLYLTRLKIYKKSLERFFISNFSYLCAVLVIQPLIGGKNWKGNPVQVRDCPLSCKFRQWDFAIK